MLLAQNPETNINNFCASADQGISTSDRFAQRVVSLGPHGYINQADDFTITDQQQVDKQDQNGLSMASLVELEHRKID